MPRDARASRGYGVRASQVGLVGLVVLILLSTRCVLHPIRVEGVAMEPTLVNGDRAFATHVFAQFERGDIVAFKYPRNESKSFVMRIVGLPGERIEMVEGTVSINGHTIAESYVDRQHRSSDTWKPHTVPEAEYFMMGDNRRNSSDSREWGTVRRDLIWAKIMGH